MRVLFTWFYEVFKACRDWGQLGGQGLSPVTVGLGFLSLPWLGTAGWPKAVPSHGRPYSGGQCWSLVTTICVCSSTCLVWPKLGSRCVLIVGLSVPGQSTLTCIAHGKKYTTLETGMQWPMLLAIASFCIPAIRIGNINISQTMIKACRNTNFKHTVVTQYGGQITCRRQATRTNEKLRYII